MIYFITWFILFCFTIYFDFLSNYQKQQKIIAKYFVLILLIIIAGLRYRLAPDTVAYQWFFNDLTPNLYDFFTHDFSTSQASYQYTWVLLNSFFYTFFDYYTFQFFLSFLSIYLLYKTSIIFTKNTLLFFYLLFCTIYFYYTMEVVRQFLALSIVLYSIQFYLSKRKIKAIILLIIALFIHRFAFIILPFYFIILINYKLRSKFIFLLLLFILFYFIHAYIVNYSGFELTYFTFDFLAYKGVLFNIGLSIILILFMFLYRNYPTSFFNGYKNILYSGLIVYLFLMLFKLTINPFFERTLDYFIPFVLFFIQLYYLIFLNIV